MQQAAVRLPLVHPSPPPLGEAALNTELVEQYLTENNWLLLAIAQHQQLGRLEQCLAYQRRLQENLLYLAAVADMHSSADGGGGGGR